MVPGKQAYTAVLWADSGGHDVQSLVKEMIFSLIDIAPKELW